MGDRAALVTGASSGIGFALASVLAEEGMSVTLVSRDSTRVAAAAERLSAEGGTVSGVAADLSQASGIEVAVAAHADRFNRLDVLVNNAGVLVTGDLGELSVEDLDHQLGLNLRSVVSMYRSARDLLLEAGQEHGNALVINMASMAGKRPERSLGAYAASKAGVIAFNESMNRELASHGVKSCAVCPSFVATPMTDFAKGEVASEEMIQPEDVAAMVRPLLHLSPAALVPELLLDRVGNVA